MELMNIGRSTSETFNPASDCLAYVDNCLRKWVQGDAKSLDKAYRRCRVYSHSRLVNKTFEHRLLLDYMDALRAYVKAKKRGDKVALRYARKTLIKLYEDV